ncbi:MAG TPA: AMP-binding protein [Pseudonocardia sp.]|jgi:fatty-acyl-CoA synthase
MTSRTTAFDPPSDLPDLLGRLVRRDPDATAVIDAGVGAVSRARLWQRTWLLVERLRAAGIGPGDCVAVWLPNWSDTLCWQFAAAALGAHVVGVNTRYNVAEVVHVLDTARPALIAVSHRFHRLDQRELLRVSVAQSAAPSPSVAVVAGPGQPAIDQAELADYRVGPDCWATGSFESGPPEDGSLAGGRSAPADPSRLAVAFTTSGSTGRPKLAAHRAAGVIGHALADAAAIGLSEDDVLLCAVPLAGTFGFSATMAAIAAGAAPLLAPVFDADAVLDDMVRHRVSHLAAGDDLVLRLEQAWRARPRDLSGWRWWGAADFQGRLRELAGWARTSFGTETTGLYGSSEVFALTAMWPPEVPAPRRYERGGRPVSPDIEVRAVDPETGAPLAEGQEGELQFRGPNVVDAYLGNPSASTGAFTEDGWFASGDLGLLVPDGGFVHTCRMGDALRLRGFLVDPAEIELRLAEHPAVRIAKVVGVPGSGGGTRAVGFVVLESGSAIGPSPAELRDWCATALARFKVPDEVRVIAEMPTTSGTNGTKIRAATLREWAQESPIGKPGPSSR